VIDGQGPGLTAAVAWFSLRLSHQHPVNNAHTSAGTTKQLSECLPSTGTTFTSHPRSAKPTSHPRLPRTVTPPPLPPLVTPRHPRQRTTPSSYVTTAAKYVTVSGAAQAERPPTVTVVLTVPSAFLLYLPPSQAPPVCHQQQQQQQQQQRAILQVPLAAQPAQQAVQFGGEGV
jgi:hypothetical protein